MAAPLRTLISTTDLEARLSDPSVTIIDCRFRLDDVLWGEREYRAGHVPGAVYANLDSDLSGPKTGANGRHPLPDSTTLAATIGGFGVGPGTQVVAYDQDTGIFASRLWWLLRWLGHDAVAVLDGGFQKWSAEGRPSTTGMETRLPTAFQASVRTSMLADLAEVTARVGASGWRLLDARAPERFHGEIEPLDRVPGHIPSAANHFFQSNLSEQGVMRSPAELREHLKEALGGVPPERTISYCGSGVTACHNLLAMECAGLVGAKLYPGSWSEWSSDPSRPVEK